MNMNMRRGEVMDLIKVNNDLNAKSAARSESVVSAFDENGMIRRRARIAE